MIFRLFPLLPSVLSFTKDLGAGANGVSGPRPRRRAWIWFFVALGILAVVWVSVEIWFNLQQQLTPEKLSDARERWKQFGPRSYDMTYMIKRPDGTDQYAVIVRNGNVTSVTRNGQPVEARLYRYSSMPALFNFIDEFLEQDRKPDSPRAFEVATFDPQDGHVLHYVRSVARLRQQQEITVSHFKAAP
jgi:Family of unknown function (DUF6174)